MTITPIPKTDPVFGIPINQDTSFFATMKEAVSLTWGFFTLPFHIFPLYFVLSAMILVFALGYGIVYWVFYRNL